MIIYRNVNVHDVQFFWKGVIKGRNVCEYQRGKNGESNGADD